jgi:hypothetical protein
MAQRGGFGVEQCRWPSYGNVALRPFLSCLRTNMDDISVAARRAVCCTYAKYTVCLVSETRETFAAKLVRLSAGYLLSPNHFITGLHRIARERVLGWAPATPPARLC